MKKKIAICFSGHFRNFHNVKNNIFEKLINPLRQNYDTDIFVQTWDTLDTVNGPKGLEGSVNLQLTQTRTDVNYILDVLDPISISILNKKICARYLQLNHINPNNKINFEALSSKYTVINGELIPFSQLLGIYLANELSSDFEIANHFEYDLIIRTRPDFCYTINILDILKFENSKLFVPNIWRYTSGQEYAINDTFAFGTRYVMDAYASTLNNYIDSINRCDFKYEENHGNSLQYGVEQSIYRNIKEYGRIEIVELGKINFKA